MLFHRRVALAEVGVDYPDLSSVAVGNLTPLMTALQPRPSLMFLRNHPGFDAGDAPRQVAEALARSRTPQVVLSSEGLMMMLTRHDLSWIWAGFDRVVAHLILRPRPLWLVSSYAQGVKTGRYAADLADMLAPGTGDLWRFATPVLSYAAHLDRLAALFGPDALRLHFLAPRFGGPVEQVLAAIGLEGFDPGPPEPRNAGQSAFVTCALARLDLDRKVPAFLDASRKVARLAARHDPFPERGLLDAATLAAVNAHFAADTEAFLAQQDRITRADLEPDLSEHTAQAVGFEEIRSHPAWADLRKALAGLGLPVPAS